VNIKGVPETSQGIRWTPTGTWVAGCIYDGVWSRKGDRVFFEVGISITGAVTAATLIVNTPTLLAAAGAALATKSTNDTVGIAFWDDAAVPAEQGGQTIRAGATAYQPLLQRLSAATNHDLAPTTNTIPKTWANNDGITMRWDVVVASFNNIAIEDL
jgi:hypothetical protein